MDRVLLGKNLNIDSTDNVGFWVSKPNINVLAIAGNSYFQGNIYGYNEQFQWTGDDRYMYTYFSNRPGPIHDLEAARSGMYSVRGRDIPPGISTGSLQVTSNTYGQYHIHVLNSASLSASEDGFYGEKGVPNSGIDETFIGEDYPLFEMKVRMPARKDAIWRHIPWSSPQVDPVPGYFPGWDAQEDESPIWMDGLNRDEQANPLDTTSHDIRIDFLNGTSEEYTITAIGLPPGAPPVGPNNPADMCMDEIVDDDGLPVSWKNGGEIHLLVSFDGLVDNKLGGIDVSTPPYGWYSDDGIALNKKLCSSILRVVNTSLPRLNDGWMNVPAVATTPSGAAAVPGEMNDHPYLDGPPEEIRFGENGEQVTLVYNGGKGGNWYNDYDASFWVFFTIYTPKEDSQDLRYKLSRDWTTADMPEDISDFRLQWRSSNSTHMSSLADETGNPEDSFWPWTRNQRIFPGMKWTDIFMTPGVTSPAEWVTIELDMEKEETTIANSSGLVVTSYPFHTSSKGVSNWLSDTSIDAFNFNFHTAGWQGAGTRFPARHSGTGLTSTWEKIGSEYEYTIIGRDIGDPPGFYTYPDGSLYHLDAPATDITSFGVLAEVDVYCSNAAGMIVKNNKENQGHGSNLPVKVATVTITSAEKDVDADNSAFPGLKCNRIKFRVPSRTSLSGGAGEPWYGSGFTPPAGETSGVCSAAGSESGGAAENSEIEYLSVPRIMMIDQGPASFFQLRPIKPVDQPDLEIDYIRAKKREIPINFGDSANDSLTFDSNWLRTGLIHAHGTIAVGTEYAFANGSSKSDGTSHAGSTSGHVDFPDLPYIPVVLFQRIDDDSVTTRKTGFSGGDKEFSHSICAIDQPTKIWNEDSSLWEDVANTNYGAEFRTFAYVRASKDSFDLTCRNAIARDGYEWLFNYAPQEPYVELYKGGNYDPATEHQDGIVLIEGDDLDDWYDRNDAQYPVISKSLNDTGVWYYGNYKGTDQGSCLPTFDWANKFGDWNIPQFNSFYQYDGTNVSTYNNFKDAIGTSWTEANTKFLDDSMWLGYANNRNEYMGDIWHPQAPTKTFSERGGLLGFGGQTHDGPRGISLTDSLLFDITEPYVMGDVAIAPRVGMDNLIYGPPMGNPKYGVGHHPMSTHIWDQWTYPDFLYSALAPVSGDADTARWAEATQHGVVGLHKNPPTSQILLSDAFGYFPLKDDDGVGPGTYAMYDRPNFELKNFPPFTDSSSSLTSPASRKTVYATHGTWGDPDDTKSEEYTITRSYTLPGATYAYDISNFSGPAHYNVWIKNKEVNDYVERDVTQYKSVQTFKRPAGVSPTTPGVDDARHVLDPPLSAVEQDLQKADKTMINHFRQSYEYNLPGKSPHRDGTLRPLGYGPYPCALDFDPVYFDPIQHITNLETENDFTYGDGAGRHIGTRITQKTDGTFEETDHLPKYPASGLYVRPRGGKAGYGASGMYAMQRHGPDQRAKSMRPGHTNEILIGGISSNPSKTEKSPPGLAISAHTVNLYPMAAPETYVLPELGSSREITIVPMKNIMSGEMNMYSRHQNAIDQYGVVGEPERENNSDFDRINGRGWNMTGEPDGSQTDIRKGALHYVKPAEPTWYYLQGNIFPGMCKADNSLTYWGTEDLSAWTGGSYFPTKEVARTTSSGTYMKSSYRGQDGLPAVPQNSDYQSFSGLTRDIPEFQPVTGDGRFFGAVGGCNNRTPGFGDLLGPSLSPEPNIWDLKWNSIVHPTGVVPDPEEMVGAARLQANVTFYGETSIDNQTSYIGGAPNARTQLDDPTDYSASAGDGGLHQSTPLNYDWAIGAPRINCNEWDRKLKTKELSTTKGNTAYHFQYTYDAAKIKPPVYKFWVLRIPAGLESVDCGE